MGTELGSKLTAQLLQGSAPKDPKKLAGIPTNSSGKALAGSSPSAPHGKFYSFGMSVNDLGVRGWDLNPGLDGFPSPGMFSGVHYPAAHSICSSRCSSRAITGNGLGRELGRLPELSQMRLLKSWDPSAIPSFFGDVPRLGRTGRSDFSGGYKGTKQEREEWKRPQGWNPMDSQKFISG